MSLNISDFENIDYFFGDIVDTMANDLLREILARNYNRNLLEKFDSILETLKNSKSNIDGLIDNFKKRKDDFYRFNSLISEIKAGYYLYCNNHPVKFIEEGNGKTPDIQTEIDGENAYVEVKSISEKTFMFEKISEELNKNVIPYDVALYVQHRFYDASDVIREFVDSFKKIDEKDIKDDFSPMINYKYGQFEIRNKKGSKPVYMPIISYTLPQSKQDKEKFFDAYTSSEEIESGIKSALEKAVNQLDSYSKESDLCFVFFNNLDASNYSIDEFFNFLYGGREVFHPHNESGVIKEAMLAYKQGWTNILYELGFIPKHTDYSEERGWVIYSEEAKSLNGMFYCEDRYFSPDKVYCFLNPFVKEKRTHTRLEYLLPYYSPNIAKKT